MIILGIDPSVRSGTGLAIVDVGANRRPEVLATAVVHLSDREIREWPHSRKESWIAHGAASWAAEHTFDAVALEWPIEHNQVRTYRRQDGSTGTRLASSHSQWRLIGRLQAHFEEIAGWPVLVSPGDAKAAVGLRRNTKRKPVEEVQRLTGHDLSAEHKYVREAIADAVAIAIAGKKKLTLATMRAG